MTIADINLEIDSLCDTNTTSYPLAVKLRRVNNAYEKVVGMLIGNAGSWEFDDTNFTDFPRGQADLVAGQKDYTFDSSHLAIERVQVKDENGKNYFLKPIDKRNFNTPLDEYFDTDGSPEFYDKDGKSILIYPGAATANVTTTDGIRVDFRRTADVFTSGEVTTGTKVPGFASPYHEVLVYMAAIPYCMTYKKDRVVAYQNEVDKILGNESKRITGTLLEFYAKRERDVRDILTTKRINHR